MATRGHALESSVARRLRRAGRRRMLVPIHTPGGATSDSMPRALIVEDDVHIRDLIVLHLGLERLHEASAVSDGRHALDRISTARNTRPGAAGPHPTCASTRGVAVRALRRSGPNQDAPVLMPQAARARRATRCWAWRAMWTTISSRRSRDQRAGRARVRRPAAPAAHVAGLPTTGQTLGPTEAGGTGSGFERPVESSTASK